MKNGKLTDFIRAGSAEVLRHIDQIAFVPFDYRAETKRVDAIHGGVVLLVADGATYEIRFVSGAVDYTLKVGNLMPYIDFYAPDSPKIAKLKALIDYFALVWGRAQFEQ